MGGGGWLCNLRLGSVRKGRGLLCTLDSTGWGVESKGSRLLRQKHTRSRVGTEKYRKVFKERVSDFISPRMALLKCDQSLLPENSLFALGLWAMWLPQRLKAPDKKIPTAYGVGLWGSPSVCLLPLL